MYFNFHVPVYASIGVVILSFFLAFVGLQSTGETDINPTGAVGKVTQLVFSRIPGAELHIAIAIPLFLLYASAYPCILVEGAKCQFPTPAVTAWANTCRLLTGGGTIPKESLILTIVLGVVAILNVVIRVNFVPDKWKPYWPNLNAFGLGFVNVGVNVPCCMLIGWVAGQLWLKFGKASHGRLMYSVSAGLISGIGIAGVIKAALTIGNVPGKNILVGCGPKGGLCM
ncbi:hypothetical protein CPB97_005825 [Podila verticillata]|nr:hypothetical protein CPB97_005825 [Podila verticillata]